MKKSKKQSQDEPSLFRDAFADIKPLQQNKVVHKKPKPQKQQVVSHRHQAPADHYFSDQYQPALPSEGPMRFVRNGANPYEPKKLRRGDYQPELLLDLHGLTQIEARREIIALIDACVSQHHACASVMHGLGTGVLKQQVPMWLAQHPAVIAFHQAPLAWGGKAALLVLIDTEEPAQPF